jgi:putative ABC transport system permease protein
MRLGSRLRSWSRAILHRSRYESDMDAELRFHIEARAEDLIRNGVSREDALRRARIEFGGVERAKEECRDARGISFLESLFQDLRFALRMLRKSPGFTLIAVLTLALGIGANTAIFSVVYSVLLRPLPFPHADQLISVLVQNPQKGVKFDGASYTDFDEWQRQNRVFSVMAGVAFHALTMTGHGEPDDVPTLVVTPNIFSLLEIPPLLGRTFLPEDGVRGAAPVVILSEELWRSSFGADPKVLGTTVNLDQRAFTIIGVMPANFHVPIFNKKAEIWIPLVQDPLFGSWMTRQGGHWLPVIGRLKPGISLAQARADMDAINANLTKESPAEHTGWVMLMNPLQQALVGDVKSALLVLLAAVGLVLLIACVNIANLMLARATSRTKEIALRLAVGAARPRIIRQLLTESLVLGSLGAIAGILLALWGVHALVSFLPPDLPLFQPVRVYGWVLAFAVVLSLVASLGFGLAPALLTAHSDVQASLKEGASRSGESGHRRRVRNFLAASEVALALILIVAAGLLLRSFLSLTSVNPGFNAEQIVKAQVSLPRFQYSRPQQWADFASALMERIQAQPGMKDSANAAPLPLADGFVNLAFSIPDSPPLPPGTPNSADYVSVGPNYFQVMGIPLLRGRTFSSHDSMSSPRVALISEAFARFYFPNQDPVGKRLVFGFPPDTNVSREIVGVVGDVRDVSLHNEPGSIMYVPFSQEPFWGADIVVKSTLAPSSVIASIRQAVWSLDKNLPITDIASMPDVLESSVAQPRFRTWLLGLFGVVALLLAAAGIFGVISYSVSCRTQEIGIRVALGASPSSILKMVLREGLLLAVAGLCVGAVAALVLARFLKSQLYGVGAYDPLTFVGAALILIMVALAVCYIPARRATKVDPLVALRYE